jgi:hypothetical protein
VALAAALAWGCAAEQARKSGDQPTESETRGADGLSSDGPSAPATGEGADGEKEGKSARASALGPQGPDILIGAPAKQGALKPSASPPDDPTRALLVTIDTPYEIFEGQGTYVHVAAWRTDGTPAAGATVYAGTTPVGVADTHGSLVFLYPPKGAAKEGAVGASEIVVVDAQDPARRGAVEFGPNIRTASFESDHLFAYTDRGVYRPGETVRVRVLGWHLKEDYTPLVEADVDVTLTALSDGALIGGGARTTDEFGVASAEIALPTSAPDGLYELAVGYGSARRTARLQVRDFAPPRVRIAHDLGRFVTRAQKKLSADVTLTPSAGGVFGKGRLKLEARAADEVVFSIARDVKGAGPHTIGPSSAQLAALKGALAEGEFATLELSIEADGVTDEVERAMRFVENPYVAVLETDKDQYSTGEEVTIVAKVRDLDGVPMRKDAIKLVAGSFSKTLETDASGAATFRFTMPDSGVVASLYRAGVSSPIATAPLRWMESRAMVSRLEDATIKERRTAKVKVRFPAGIVPAEKVVHLDVVDTTGALVNAVLLPVSEEGGEVIASGEFSAPSWGSMLLTFFALGRRVSVKPNPDAPHHALGLLTEGQNLVVHPDKELEIVLDGLPDAAAPGQTVTFRARVKDPTGAMVTASVGASVVDARALAMKDPLEITPMDVFYEPTLRTMSTTGSKILSWPVVSRNWGPSQIDIALPPFNYLEGGAVNTYGGGFVAMGAVGDGEPMDDGVMVQGSSSKAKKKKPAYKKSASKGSMLGKGGGGGAASAGVLGALDAPMAEEADEPEPEMSEGVGRRSARASGKRPPVITIRTNFDETSMWEPHARAGGVLELSATMPDAITTQTVTLVASDAKGGVGIARAELAVRQDLHARVDLPGALILGEAVDVPVVVTNDSKVAQTVKLSWTSPTLKATFGQDTLTLAPGTSAPVVARVQATRAGEADYRLVASAGSGRDEVAGRARVLPVGAPTERVARGVAARGAPFTATFQAAGANDAWAQVTFPAVTAQLMDLDALHATMRQDPLSLASDLVSAAALIDYATRHDIASPRIEELRRRVLAAAGAVQFAQQKSGAWSYWRAGRPSPYVTAWTVEGLLEAARVGAPLDAKVLRRAGDWLTAGITKDAPLISNAEVAWWEGDTQAVRLGLTAEVFDTLSRVPASSRSAQTEAALEVWTELFTRELGGAKVDPLVAAHALSGLRRLGALDAAEVSAAIRRVMRSRDEGYWEPSWFHAHGGRLEATAAIVVALTDAGATGADAVALRDSLSYLVSQRGTLGAWHSERATAAVLRALARAGVAPTATGGTLVVERDGVEVARQTVDPNDPFAATLALGRIPLGENLAAGAHTVRVRYDGAIAPAVQVVSRSWSKASVKKAKGRVGGATFELSARAPAKITAGKAANLEITLSGSPGEGGATLKLAPSALGAPLGAALAETIGADPSVRAVRVRDGWLVVELAESFTQATFTVPFRATRRGAARWPAAVVGKGGDAIAVTAGALVVE